MLTDVSASHMVTVSSKTLSRLASRTPRLRRPKHLPRGSYLLLRLASGRQLYVSSKHWLFTLASLPAQPCLGEPVNPAEAELVWLSPQQVLPGQWLIIANTLDCVEQVIRYE